MDIALSFAGLIAVGIKILSVIKFIDEQDRRALYYQVGAWVVGILLAFWGAEIQGIQATQFGDIALGDMTVFTKLYIGLALGSAGSLTYDAITAIDNNRTSRL